MALLRGAGILWVAVICCGRAEAASLSQIADSISARAASVSAPPVAAVWTRVKDGIRAGQGPAMLDLLDSLRASGAALPESFHSDFAALTAYSMLPGLADAPMTGGGAGRGGCG
jgi:hypothetical protein